MAITSRINGTDGLIAIIQESVDGIGLSSRPLFDKTLVEHGFSYLKKLRDAVIHATILDTTTALATAPGKRGKKPEEVLLAPKALEGLYRRLVFVTWELQSLERIMSSECAIRLSHAFGVTDGQRKQHNERDIQDATARCLRNQSQRLSLPPFPKFPDPPDVREVLRKWHEDYHANLWFQVEG